MSDYCAVGHEDRRACPGFPLCGCDKINSPTPPRPEGEWEASLTSAPDDWSVRHTGTCMVTGSWPTKREAEAVAAALNALESPTPPARARGEVKDRA